MKSEDIRNEFIKEKTLEQIDDEYFDKLEELKSELKNAFEIDPDALVDENMKTISKIQYYLSRLAEEKKILRIMNRKKTKLYSDLMLQIESENRDIALSQNAKETRLERKPEWQMMDTYFTQQTDIVDYLDRIIKALDGKRYTLRNIQDHIRMERG